jgi:hypothetical protein
MGDEKEVLCMLHSSCSKAELTQSTHLNHTTCRSTSTSKMKMEESICAWACEMRKGEDERCVRREGEDEVCEEGGRG